MSSEVLPVRRSGPVAVLVTLAVTLIALFAVPQSSKAAYPDGTGFGIADPVYGQQLPETYVARLAPKVYRVLIPYDLTTCSPSYTQQLKDRLIRVTQLGVQHVLGTFTMSCMNLFGSIGRPYYLPTNQEYADGIAGAFAEFGQWVDAWSPANEPNHIKGWFGDSIDAGGPARLAGYYKTLMDNLPAGDELVSPEFTTTASPTTGALREYNPPSDTRSPQRVFISRYLNALASPPLNVSNGWGSHAAFHPYDSVTSRTRTALDELEQLAPGKDVWLTEIGGLVPNQNHHAAKEDQLSPLENQSDQVNWLANTVQSDSRISRAYYYNPYEVTSSSWDSSLIDDNGNPRIAWSIWCNKARYFPNGSAAPCGSGSIAPFYGPVASEDYHVWRQEPEAGWINTPQVAERVVAKESYVRSASFNIGASPDGRVKVSIFADAAQTQLLGSKIVNVSMYGETIANFDPAISVTPNQPYYVQAMPPTGSGSLQIYYSTYSDDYRPMTTYFANNPGGAQYNWGNWGGSSFAGPNVNGRVLTSTDDDREIYSVSRIATQSSSVTVGQLAQKFTATLPTITSASARVTPGPSGKVTFVVYKDAAQTQPVPGGAKTVTANPDPTKNTVAVFDSPLAVTLGAKYYLQVLGLNGESFTVKRAIRNDYVNGGGQYAWDTNGFTGPDVVGRITGTDDTSINSYWVWRYEPEANWINTPQAAQQFRATNATVRSVSANIGSSPNGQVTFAIYRNKSQNDLVAGSVATVPITPFGETKATYSNPVAVTPGQMYYLQVMRPAIAPGNLQLYRSGYDDYREGGAQYNWDSSDFTGYDINSRIISGP